MKDFSEFVSELDDATVSKILIGANKYAEKVATAEIKPDSVPGGQIMAISFTIALALLGCYHDWLER